MKNQPTKEMLIRFARRHTLDIDGYYQDEKERDPHKREIDAIVRQLKAVRKQRDSFRKQRNELILRSVVVMSELDIVSDYFLDDTFEVTKESASNLVSELQSHKFTIESQQRKLNKLGLIKREHAKWLHGKITVVQFAYNVEEILNNLEDE